MIPRTITGLWLGESGTIFGNMQCDDGIPSHEDILFFAHSPGLAWITWVTWLILGTCWTTFVFMCRLKSKCLSCCHVRNDKYLLLSLLMKTKVVQHGPRTKNLNIKHLTYDIWYMTSWHYDMKTWQHDKQSPLRKQMKTKVDQHVPRKIIKDLIYDSMTNNQFWAHKWKL